MSLFKRWIGVAVALVVVVAIAGCGNAPPQDDQDTEAQAPESETQITGQTPELVVDDEVDEAAATLPEQNEAQGAMTGSAPVDAALLDSVEGEADAADTEQALQVSTQEADTKEVVDLDAPVAKVGDEEITGREFQREMHMIWQRMEIEQGQHVDPPPNFRLDILNALINARVMRSLAKNSDIEVSDDDVMQEFETRKGMFDSEAQYHQYLEVNELTEEALLQSIRNRLLTDAYLDSLVDDAELTDAVLEAEYAQLVEEGNMERQVPTVDVAHILIRVEDTEDEAAWEEARERIEAARQRIEEGEAFEDVAREVSEDYLSADRGGLYPESTRGRVPAAVDEVMFDMEDGELSEPLRGEAGWHLIKVLQHNEPGLIPFDVAKDQIRDYVLNNMQMEEAEEEINQAKLVMNIEIYDAEAEEIPLEHQHQ